MTVLISVEEGEVEGLSAVEAEGFEINKQTKYKVKKNIQSEHFTPKSVYICGYLQDTESTKLNKF